MTTERLGDNPHRFFLQWLLSERLATESAAMEFLKRAYQLCEIEFSSMQPDCVSDVLALVTPQLTRLDLAIKTTIAEDDGIAYVGIVNMNGDEIAQLATDFSTVEITLFKRTVRSFVLAASLLRLMD